MASIVGIIRWGVYVFIWRVHHPTEAMENMGNLPVLYFRIIYPGSRICRIP